MPMTNTARRYGTVTKTFHWLTALLIFANIALGLIAQDLSPETQLALKAQVFTIHKTLGLAIFAVAILRILWAVTQQKPAHLHPDRTAETFAAELVHWVLYASLVVIPLSGWITHAATEGFAPIWWPFPQNLPGLVENEAVAAIASTAHWLANWMLAIAIVLHIAGALKHHVLDRDATLSRMWFGRTEAGGAAPHRTGPALPAAAALYTLAAVAVVGLSADALVRPEAQASGPTAGAGNWTVQSGSLAIEVMQFGNAVDGGFGQWSADIDFSEETGEGQVTVRVDVFSLTLGSVTEQALGPAYFAAEDHPEAVFEGAITPDADRYVANGPLSLAGETTDVTLPFTLTIDGDTARMEGETTLDRLSFGIGESQDAGTLGLDVPVRVTLTATRAE